MDLPACWADSTSHMNKVRTFQWTVAVIQWFTTVMTAEEKKKKKERKLKCNLKFSSIFKQNSGKHFLNLMALSSEKSSHQMRKGWCILGLKSHSYHFFPHRKKGNQVNAIYHILSWTAIYQESRQSTTIPALPQHQHGLVTAGGPETWFKFLFPATFLYFL